MWSSEVATVGAITGPGTEEAVKGRPEGRSCLEGAFCEEPRLSIGV